MTENQLGLLGILVLFRVAKGAKHPVHPDCVMTVIVAVRCVVDGVVTRTHHRPHLPVDAIMDVGRPYRLAKEQSHMSGEVARYDEQCNHMRYGL